MAKLRKRPHPEEEFQMAPMIDMVFLLLVFFMCVSTLAQAEKGVELELPKSHESKVPEDLADRGNVSVDADGQVYVGLEPVDLAGLKARISDALQKNPDLRIWVRADQTTSYGMVKPVLKTCAEAGAYEVIYATHQAN